MSIKNLEDLFLNPPKQETVIDGIKFIPRSFRTFFIEKDGTKKLVKRVLDNRIIKPFIYFKKIPDIDLILDSQQLLIENTRFEIFNINSNAKHSNTNCVDKLTNLYTYSQNIIFLKENTLIDVQHFVWETAHRFLPIYNVTLGDIAFKLLENQTYDLSKCKKGFFHGDVHCGNILEYKKSLQLIDFDEVKYSYVALNLAQFFAMDVLKDFGQKLISVQTVKLIRQKILSKLEKEDAYYFDFFVSLMSYYWNVRLIPTVFEEGKRKTELIKSLQDLLPFIISLQDGDYYPALGSNCLKDGKVLFF